MLRALIALALVVAPVALADELQRGVITYREPTAAELERQQGYAAESLQQGQGFFESQAFQDSLAKERARLSLVPDQLPENKIELPAGVMGQTWGERYNEAEAKANEMAKAPVSVNKTVIVFASLSMPRENLKALAAEAKKIGAAIVFRGLKNDDFIAMRQELAGLGEGFAIDPTLFKRFGVEEVPTFVLPVDNLLPCDMDGCPPVRHVKLAGNLGLEGALDFMRLNANEPGAKALADDYLKKMRNE